MKTTALMIGLAVFAATPVSAAEKDDIAEWVNTLIFYDHFCESIPGLMPAAVEALSPIPREVNQAASKRVSEFFDSAGANWFCETTKARIAANHTWKFQNR